MPSRPSGTRSSITAARNRFEGFESFERFEGLRIDYSMWLLRRRAAMSQDSRSTGWTRREALGMLGMGAVAAALPELASAATPTFPKGAVIRTILKDYAPEELGGGATLFHEHMSFASDFMTRWTGYAAETRAINSPPAAAGAGATGGRG